MWIGKEAEDALKFFEEHPNESILAIEIIKGLRIDKITAEEVFGYLEQTEKK